MIINILSIDWNFFFPDSKGFDWGHNEAPFFIEDIWYFRVNHIDMITKKQVLDFYLPRSHRNFWEKIIKVSPRFLLVSESHSNMWQAINEFIIKMEKKVEYVSVWNFDAHHDLSYSEKKIYPKYIDCSNWAYVSLRNSSIDNYNLIYPEWRENKKEKFDWKNFKYPVKVYYQIPEQIPEFDIVFICRSGAWTPPWCDKQWVEFVSWWKRYPDLWKDKTLFHNPLRLRKPSLEEAKDGFNCLEEVKKNFMN